MKTRRKIFLFLIACVALTIGIFASQKSAWYLIGYTLDQIHLWIAHKDCSHSLKVSDLPEAADKYQRLAKEAYINLHVSNPIAVKKYPTGCLLKESVITAYTENTFMIINQEALDKDCPAFQKFAIYHEAIHAKYSDKLVFTIKAISLFFCLTIALSNISMAIPLIASYIITLKRNSPFMEYRADQEAAYGMNCAICLLQSIKTRDQVKVASNALRGYCSFLELLNIAEQQFEQQSACSEEHKAFLEKYAT